MSPVRYRVIESWQATFDEPIALETGDSVSVGRRDDEWPEFVWCTTQAGRGGWVPTEILDHTGPGRATVATAYDTRELTVEEGESVVGYQSLAGWIWCESRDGGTGWVPDRCLAA